MIFISAVLRALFNSWQSLCSMIRVTKLNLLYPGANIAYSNRIGPGCSIVCIKGGRLEIAHSFINAGTHIFADTKSDISISHCYIGRNCVITAKQKITIRPNALIAEMVVIRDQDHSVDMVNGRHSRDQFIVGPVEIRENVWIASKASILKGVTIGEFSVIAASAVVNSDVPAYEVWGGLPAKFIKTVQSAYDHVDKGNKQYSK